MPDPHFEILPKVQQRLWKELQQHASILRKLDLYLAGGTALALQIGHRQSQDFDFFSQQSGIAEPLCEWLQTFPRGLIRETDAHTVHAELDGVKVSFIGDYPYPLVGDCVVLGKIAVASIADTGLMKLLAITHRATLRDYLDLAIILRDHVKLDKLLKMSNKKFGKRFNVMIPLKALVSFHDVDQEMPPLRDRALGRSWQGILTQAVKEVAL